MSMITCQICGSQVHSVQLHLRDDHAEWTVEEYQKEFPDSPLLSEAAKERLEKRKAETTLRHMNSTNVVPIDKEGGEEMVAMGSLFGLGKTKAALSATGNPIMIKRYGRAKNSADLIPDSDDNFVYDIEVLKNVLLGFDLNIPTYLWGHAGTGKSSFVEQVCAKTNRPLIRIQHTVNTEESHIVGQWTARDGSTHFELGPLAIAMKEGYVYMADEYDFALPSVLSVYQSVLEGKSLMIKEADTTNRVIKPHPNFRFVATGNTNGSGDETGLYQGTNMQNAANYDRFGVVCKVNYMPQKMEVRILVGQSGIDGDDADRLVKLAKEIRDAYDAGKISSTISPRALVNAAKVGVRRGSLLTGFQLAFGNKLSQIDQEVCTGLAQR